MTPCQLVHTTPINHHINDSQGERQGGGHCQGGRRQGGRHQGGGLRQGVLAIAIVISHRPHLRIADGGYVLHTYCYVLHMCMS